VANVVHRGPVVSSPGGDNRQGLGVLAGDNWLFRDLDLSVARGECLALTGANGSGKSTLLRCLYGTQPPTEGKVFVSTKRRTNGRWTSAVPSRC